MNLQVNQQLRQLLDGPDRSVPEGCFRQNQAFILYLSLKCSNAQDIKSNVLTNLFGKSVDEINQLENSDFFNDNSGKMKKKFNRQKSKIQEASSNYAAKDLSLSQNVLVKHILRTLTSKKTSSLHIQLMQFQLKVAKDPDLSKLTKIGRDYEWTSFLIYAIIRNNQSNINFLSKLLQIPCQKLLSFYHQRQKAVKKAFKQDTQKQRRLLKLFQNKDQIWNVQDQMERALVNEAINNYSFGKVKRLRKEANQDRFLGQLLDKDCDKLKSQKQQHQIYYSDQETVQTNPSQNSMQVDFKPNQVKSYSPDSQTSNAQGKTSNLYQQKERQNYIIPPIRKGQKSLWSIQKHCFQSQQDEQLSKSQMQAQKGFQQVLSQSQGYSQGQVQGQAQEQSQSQDQVISVKQAKLPNKVQHYSYQDQAILYLLFRTNGPKGLKGLLAQRILKRPSQQLFKYFFTMKVYKRSRQLQIAIQSRIQTLQKYPQLLRFQKNAYMLVLVDKLKADLHSIQGSQGTIQQTLSTFQGKMISVV